MSGRLIGISRRSIFPVRLSWILAVLPGNVRDIILPGRIFIGVIRFGIDNTDCGNSNKGQHQYQ